MEKTYLKEESERLCKLIDAEKKLCYRNALLALWLLKDPEKYVYVEGWIVDLFIPLYYEHGWIETKEEVIDPTRPLHEDKGYIYYSGVKYPNDKNLYRLATKKTLPLVHWYPRFGLSVPEYEQAELLAKDDFLALVKEGEEVTEKK